MNIKQYPMFGLVAIMCAGLLLAGCPKKEAEEPMEEPKVEEPVAPEQPTVEEPTTKAVHFAFDSSELDAASRAILDANAEWLNANANVSIAVEGNCDERGTREYNQALGDRRAQSVKDYLVSRGVDAGRIDTVSYGEEKPVCSSSGEACWTQNRRADIVNR